MERINSESFEKVLKDKYGIEWEKLPTPKEFHGEYGNYITKGSVQIRTTLYNGKQLVRKSERIGIMVIELLSKGVYVETCDKELQIFKLSINLAIKHKDLYQILKQAVESIDWTTK